MQANQQGTFYKSLTVERNGENYSNTILKTEFLKKSENYSCVVRSFVTNITPPLNLSKEVAFQIFVRGGGGDNVDDSVFPAYWRTSDTQFTPTPYHSTIEFLRQAQQFFHRFGFLVRTIGVAGVPPVLETPEERAQGYPFLKNHITGAFLVNGEQADTGWENLDDEGRMVKCRMKSDGVFQIEMSAEFANLFYIQVGPETRSLLGFVQHLYVIMQDNDVQSQTVPLINPVVFPFPQTFADLADNVVERSAIFDSSNALHQLDERLSIDVVCTLPLSNRIFSKDGDEEHEFILARFPLNDYNRFETTLESTPEKVTDTVIVREDVNVGLEDLTRKSPSSSSIFMLPGTVQQINFRLFTRYFSKKKIMLSPTAMGDGFWSLTLLFGKKV